MPTSLRVEFSDELRPRLPNGRERIRIGFPKQSDTELRRGGYVIDFWGLGYDIAERMGLTREINRAGYHSANCERPW